MRIAIVSESFLPRADGVSDTVRHVLDELLAAGHEALVVAPAPGLSDYRGVPVVRVRSVTLPGPRRLQLGLPDLALHRALAAFRPDVCHLASPFVLGASGLAAARRLGVPVVADYQTDVAAFARSNGLRADTALTGWVGRLHRRADRTLAPSRSALTRLDEMGVRSELWKRGVDLDLFSPRHRNASLHDHWARARHAGGPRVVVGYVGRLAAEKQVRRLAEVARVPGTRLVVVGEGAERRWIEAHVPEARFTGQLCGRELAQAVASLDVLVHPGEAETSCEAVQEAQAAGVPVVAPAAGGPVDHVQHGRTGLLYDPADPRALRRAVGSLVGNPDQRRTLAAHALAAVSGQGWQSAVEELVGRHYTAVLRGTTPGASVRHVA